MDLFKYNPVHPARHPTFADLRSLIIVMLKTEGV
jgi:hypothetical protein